jgi:ribosomal protein S18 acetylase RimI-like enzyme
MGEGLRARPLGFHDRAETLELLSAHPDENLVLVDMVGRLGVAQAMGELVPQIHGVFEGRRLVGVAALRPSVVLSSGMTEETLDVLLPVLRRVPGGLIKSERGLVEGVWKTLEAAGRRTTIDRIEIAYRLIPERMVSVVPTLPGFARPARPEDLDELVHAARASLWEEDRPDPADGDPVGFRRWVESRLGRARIVSENGRMVFAAYADVRRPEGWLIQGVYTWPEARRRGFARRGMDSMIREAFATGAAHVQLAVVEGNERASALYRNLGFEPFAELRTILFH